MPTFTVTLQRKDSNEKIEITADKVDFVGFGEEHVFADFVDEHGKTIDLIKADNILRVTRN